MAILKRIQITSPSPAKRVNEILKERKISKGNLLTISETGDNTIIWYWDYNRGNKTI